MTKSAIDQDIIVTVAGYWNIFRYIKGTWYARRESDGYAVGPFRTRKGLVAYVNKRDIKAQENKDTRIEHQRSGNSGKQWYAVDRRFGNPVMTASGERTVFTCGSEEADQYERRYDIYLWKIKA